MNFVDTHTHLYDQIFDKDRDLVIQNALRAGVTKLLLPAIDSTTIRAQQTLAEQYPNVFSQMIGLHPTSVKANYKQELGYVEQLLNASPRQYVALGEIGLDFYWDVSYKKEQMEVLNCQLRWGYEYRKPIVLHVRNAYKEIFEELNVCKTILSGGVFHCFSGTLEQAWNAIEIGFYLGIGGVVTFKNSELAEIVKQIPLSKLVLETDAPYLAPHPYRGKRNESAYCRIIAEKIAELKNCSLEMVAEITTQNAEKIFDMKE